MKFWFMLFLAWMVVMLSAIALERVYPIQHCGWYGEQCDGSYSRPRRF